MSSFGLILGELAGSLTSQRIFAEFVPPAYSTYCLSNVPSTATYFLGARSPGPTLPQGPIREHIGDNEGIKNVVLLVADGLGYDSFLAHSETGVFAELLSRGLVFPITTVFPTTTAAALTSLHTGLTPQEHGLIEWFLYLKEADVVITSLPFQPVLDEHGSDLRGRDLLATVDPHVLFSGGSIYERLADEGIASYALLGRAISESAYSKLALAGSEVVPYDDLETFCAELAKTLSRAKRPSYVYAYWPLVDTLGHSYGPASPEYAWAISTLSEELRTSFLSRLDPRVARETLLILVADHGHLSVDPSATIRLESFPWFTDMLAKSPYGRTVPPWGSPRDVYLDTRDDDVEGAQIKLQAGLGQDALVLASHEAFRLGLFGRNEPSQLFTERLGDVLILPRGNGTVWYRGPGMNFGMNMLGVHGGMTRNEMLVPFVISRLSDLRPR